MWPRAAGEGRIPVVGEYVRESILYMWDVGSVRRLGGGEFVESAVLREFLLWKRGV